MVCKLGAVNMVGFKLIKVNDTTAIYDYYPENKEADKGTIAYNREDGEIQFIERSKKDSRSVYAWHLGNQLDEFNATGNFEKTGYVAWY